MCYFEWVQRLVLSLRKASETARMYNADAVARPV